MAKPAEVKPLAPERYKVQFTANAELKAKLERLQALMPDADLAAIVDEAVTEKLERLEAKRFARAKRPRKSVDESDTSPSSRYIPAAVRRTVRERDGDRCTFVERGRRCSERLRLEYHHRRAFGRGGDHSPGNLQLMCPTHNLYMAECEYGKDRIDLYRSQAREPGPVYSLTLTSLGHRDSFVAT